MSYARISLVIIHTAAEWAASSQVLNTFEAGLESDTGLIKRGDGINIYSALSYLSWGSGGGGGPTGPAGGELAGTYPNPTLANASVIGKLLTGLSVSGSAIIASDTILQAFGKAQNQINALVGGVNYQGTWNATTNSPALADGVGTKGYYYVVSVAGSTSIDGITDWKLGDWIIFNGTTWQKVDNTDAVISVNGQLGIVVLTTNDVADSTNKRYVTDAQLVILGNTSGTNTGDQTSIVGITGTKAQFNTANSDGDFMFVGDAITLDYNNVLYTQIFS